MSDYNTRSESAENTDSSVERRSVLQGVAAAGAATVGVTGFSGSAAAARPENVSAVEEQRAISGYESVDAVDAALREHEDFLAELEAEGMVDSGAVEDISPDELRQPAPERDGEGEIVRAIKADDEATPEIVLFRNLEEGMLSIIVRPELGERAAIMNPHDDDTEPYDLGNAACFDCSKDCCNCKMVCCNCCACSPCGQCFSCTCGMCYQCQCNCGGSW